MRTPSFISSIASRITLRLAVVLAVFIGLLVTSLAIIPAQLRSIRADSLAKLEADHKRATEILSVILSEPVWQITPEIAKASSEVVFSDPNVAEINVITLPDKKTFITNSRKASQKGAFRSKSRDILHGEQIIGEVQLIFAEDEMDKEIKLNIYRAIFVTAISFLLSVICIYVVLQWRLVRPIKDLIQKSDRLAVGELNEVIAFDRKDEIGHLAVSL
ncbi:MAG: HAMP domain-containing protein, partial [Burkholderiales bacterium]|nr:HAMP domain-containing protein [Burkholderiales bacterium]